MKNLITLSFICLFSCTFAQSLYMPLQDDTYHLMDRLDIKVDFKNNYLATNQLPFNQQKMVTMIYVCDSFPAYFKASDRKQHYYIFKKNNFYTEDGLRDNAKPLFNTFYKLKTDFYDKRTDDFKIQINPVLHFGVGSYTTDSSFSGKESQTTYQNTRGFELKAELFNKLGIYSYFTDNQAIIPNFIRDYSFYSRGNPRILRWNDINNGGFDYFDYKGYISFPIFKKIDFQFGHDRNKLGYGVRSLFLSENAGPYLFGKINANFGRFSFTNIWSQLTTQFDRSLGDRFLPKKYQATHHLNYNVNNSFTIGLFETVVFERENGYDLNYLNPVVIYKAVEWYLGSPDNSLIGADFKYNFLQRFSLYGQLLMDEFRLDRLFPKTDAEKGWWANKYAYQIGLKSIDLFGVSQLDAQIEYNSIRPFTYTYNNGVLDYTHYNTALAHPAGANLREVLLKLRYQIKEDWLLKNHSLFFQQGLHPQGFGSDFLNSGADIFLENDVFRQEFGNETLQGNLTTRFYNSTVLTYSPWHNVFIDMQYVFTNYRINSTGILPVVSEGTNHYFGLSMRMNTYFVNEIF